MLFYLIVPFFWHWVGLVVVIMFLMQGKFGSVRPARWNFCFRFLIKPRKIWSFDRSLPSAPPSKLSHFNFHTSQGRWCVMVIAVIITIITKPLISHRHHHHNKTHKCNHHHHHHKDTRLSSYVWPEAESRFMLGSLSHCSAAICTDIHHISNMYHTCHILQLGK